MKSSFGRMLTLAGAAVSVMVPISGPAQEFFRELGTSRSSGGIGPVQPSEYSYRDASPSGLTTLDPEAEAKEEDTYNFAIGPVRFSMAVGFGVEFNDNITLSDIDRKSDVILRPSLNIDASWRMSDLNTLRFSLGASYAKYLDHSEYDTDGVLLSPTSELAFNFMVGQVKVTLRDRFSYQEDPYDIAAISNVARYRRWENQAGVQLDWEASSSLTVTGGYDHYNLWTQDEIFSDQDRSIDTVFLKPSYALTPTLKVGVSASASYINFTEDARDDGSSILIGPFIEWQLSQYTNLYVEVGYQQMKFDGNGVFSSRLVDEASEDFGLTDEERDLLEGEFSDQEDTNSYYVRFELNNRPSDIFQHRLSGSKTAEIGFLSNYYDLYHVEYSADWKIIRDTSISPTVFYEYYETSGNLDEQAHRIGAAIGIRHNLSESLTLGLDYRFLWKDSNLQNADYYQNLAFLSVYYKF